MKLLVAGTGGVGGYYGGRLLQAGHEVWFMARGENLLALRQRGLEIRSAHGDARFERVHACATGEESGPVEAVVFCVKTYDNEAAADAVAPALADATTICSLQNGVDNERFLAERFPSATVVGGVSRIEAWLEAPGVVIQRGAMADFTTGPFRDEDRPAAQALVDAFAGTPVPAILAVDVQAALWQKLLIIAGFGGVSAYCRCSAGEVRDDPTLVSLMGEAMEEVAAVASARGTANLVGLADVVLQSVQTALEPEAKSSMCRDVERGRPLEVEAINGAVVRYGEEAGVPTPRNRTILDALLPLHRAALVTRSS